MKDAQFPCVGAKSALARGTLKTVVCRDLASGWDDLPIHRELLRWSSAYDDDPDGLRSLAFIFRSSGELTEQAFEKHMWSRIQSLSDKDSWLGQSPDAAVSGDPDDPHFALSFGGRAYFVVGLHPAASRPARRFERPVMVFNLHDQFEKLRAEQRYERMRETILDRDLKLAGSANPMLAKHGEKSAAAQYSGRVVGDDWTCPFSNPRERV
ncbi:MAG: guanitoxin biosynthesis heme-dependent pre-guanitoxin N-hydroxylase GntA [Alteraurantiacibacter sp.]